jgi:hypothetical protein
MSESTSDALLNSVIESAPITTRSLPRTIWTFISHAWNKKNINFTEDHPNDKILGPTICWKVHRRLPGREGTERNKPRLRRTTSIDYQTIQSEEYAQWHTIWYQFDIYDLSNPEVNDLADEFEDLIFSLGSVFKRLGVQEFIFDEEFEDHLLPKNQSVFVRTIRYKCILEKRYSKDTPLIQEIELKYFHNRIDHLGVEVTRGVDAIDTLPDKWIYSLNSVADVAQSGMDDPSDYVAGIDYSVLGKTDGTAQINWIAGRKHPVIGTKYYCCYTTSAPDTILLNPTTDP